MSTIPSDISKARITAFKTLLLLEKDINAFSHETLAAVAKEEQLDGRDYNLATALTFGVLRKALLLDYQFTPFLSGKNKKLNPNLRILLRMIVYQKFFFDKVPDFAIINEAVNIARKIAKCNQAECGFLNAVGRKIMTMEEPVYPEGNTLKALSVRYSCPEWLCKFFYKKFGQKTELILQKCSEQPDLCVRLPLDPEKQKMVKTEFEEEGIEWNQSAFLPNAVIIKNNSLKIFESPAFLRGDIYIQDEASQLIPWIASTKNAVHILDYCSAPGGKATLLAEMMGKEGHVTAADISDSRMALIQDNMLRLHVNNMSVQHIDSLIPSEQKFQIVLVDAPCSGLGTIARNPEIRYRLREEDFASRANLQLEILNRAKDFLADNGRLVYSTCSVSDQENQNVIRKFLKMNPDFEPDFSEELHPLITGPFKTPAGFYRTWPEHLNLDGFECAVLKKRC